VPGCAIQREANWNRFSFFWAMFRCKRPSDTWGANSASVLRSTIASVSSQTLEGRPLRNTFGTDGRPFAQKQSKAGRSDASDRRFYGYGITRPIEGAIGVKPFLNTRRLMGSDGENRQQ
jgi:hypothetical protein